MHGVQLLLPLRQLPEAAWLPLKEFAFSEDIHYTVIRSACLPHTSLIPALMLSLVSLLLHPPSTFPFYVHYNVIRCACLPCTFSCTSSGVFSYASPNTSPSYVPCC